MSTLAPCDRVQAFMFRPVPLPAAASHDVGAAGKLGNSREPSVTKEGSRQLWYAGNKSVRRPGSRNLGPIDDELPPIPTRHRLLGTAVLNGLGGIA
jgi:hypothetical protein